MNKKLVEDKKNIVLIGMPGSGKSTIGVVLAKVLGFRFVDSDLLIQEREQRLLTEILDEDGPDRFNEIENQVNASIETDRAVIATGGSVVYGKEAMAHLRNIGLVVYIKLDYPEIEERVGDFHERGISMQDGQTLRDIYDERTPLYEQYAHVIVSVKNQSIRETMMMVKEVCKPFLTDNDKGES